MSWMLYAAVAAGALAAADVLVKMAAGKVANSLGMLIYGAAAFGIGLILVLCRPHGRRRRTVVDSRYRLRLRRWCGVQRRRRGAVRGVRFERVRRCRSFRR